MFSACLRSDAEGFDEGLCEWHGSRRDAGRASKTQGESFPMRIRTLSSASYPAQQYHIPYLQDKTTLSIGTLCDAAPAAASILGTIARDGWSCVVCILAYFNLIGYLVCISMGGPNSLTSLIDSSRSSFVRRQVQNVSTSHHAGKPFRHVCRKLTSCHRYE